MSDNSDKQSWWKAAWWKEPFRKEKVAEYVVGTLVGLVVTFVAGLFVTLFWVTWLAWRGSYMWTQRLIGASLAFFVCIMATALALAILRRRLVVVGAPKPVAPKGYLDHQIDSEKARGEFLGKMGKITETTLQHTELVKASTARHLRIAKLSPDKQLRARVEASRLSAKALDNTTKKLSELIPGLAKAAAERSAADLGYWRWHTENYRVSAVDARELIGVIQSSLAVNEEFLSAQADGKTALEESRGTSQVENEAIERRLVVIDRLHDAVALQRAPFLEIIALLEPFTKAPDS